MTGRGAWHRRVGWLPLVYLVGIVAIGFAHPVLPGWWWLGVHTLLLGAVTNAILIWSTHFTQAVLRAPAPASRRGEALRLVALNVGVVTVLAGGTADLGWVGLPGSRGSTGSLKNRGHSAVFRHSSQFGDFSSSQNGLPQLARKWRKLLRQYHPAPIASVAALATTGGLSRAGNWQGEQLGLVCNFGAALA